MDQYLYFSILNFSNEKSIIYSILQKIQQLSRFRKADIILVFMLGRFEASFFEKPSIGKKVHNLNKHSTRQRVM